MVNKLIEVSTLKVNKITLAGYTTILIITDALAHTYNWSVYWQLYLNPNNVKLLNSQIKEAIFLSSFSLSFLFGFFVTWRYINVLFGHFPVICVSFSYIE